MNYANEKVNQILILIVHVIEINELISFDLIRYKGLVLPTLLFQLLLISVGNTEKCPLFHPFNIVLRRSLFLNDYTSVIFVLVFMIHYKFVFCSMES